MIEDQVMISNATADVSIRLLSGLKVRSLRDRSINSNSTGDVVELASIGDVVELVELLCLAILSTPREGGKNGGRIQDTVGKLIGVTISDAF